MEECVARDERSGLHMARTRDEEWDLDVVCRRIVQKENCARCVRGGIGGGMQ